MRRTYLLIALITSAVACGDAPPQMVRAGKIDLRAGALALQGEVLSAPFNGPGLPAYGRDLTVAAALWDAPVNVVQTGPLDAACDLTRPCPFRLADVSVRTESLLAAGVMASTENPNFVSSFTALATGGHLARGLLAKLLPDTGIYAVTRAGLGRLAGAVQTEPAALLAQGAIVVIARDPAGPVAGARVAAGQGARVRHLRGDFTGVQDDGVTDALGLALVTLTAQANAAVPVPVTVTGARDLWPSQTVLLSPGRLLILPVQANVATSEASLQAKVP